MDNEEKIINEEVEKRVAAILKDHQKQFTASLELAIKNSLKGLEKANTDLEAEHQKIQIELENTRNLHLKAEREGEKMVHQAYEKFRKQYEEAIRTSFLRQLIQKHIQEGKSTFEICEWLEVNEDFVENIRRIIQSRILKKSNVKLHGNPQVRFLDFGRGGTIYFESNETKFEMWWEMGGSALAIIDIPTQEDWNKRTGLPVEHRDEILHFIGQKIIEKQTVNGSFIIGDSIMTIYSS
ncbi:MAG TPA: hypothetical protein PKC30_09770 [Saprospiraceae bacterium]|nr:hypothetical protein [Saprospiraceae bacterium]